MSLPDEHVRAQQQLWNDFCDRKLPLKRWPRHLISPAELQMLFLENKELREKCRQSGRKSLQ